MRSKIKILFILFVLFISPLPLDASDQSQSIYQPLVPSGVGDTPSTAITIDVGVENKYFGALPGPSNNSGYWFRLELGLVNQSGDFAFIMNRSLSASPNFHFGVYDENEIFLNHALGTNPKTQFEYDVIGIFYIHVIPNGDSGDFDLFVEDQAIYGGERGYTPDHAMTILPDVAVPGILPGPGSNGEMWYDIQLGYAGVLTNYRVTLTIDGGSDFDVIIHQPDFTVFVVANSTNNPEIMQFSALGVYRFNVSAVSGTGNYTLLVESLIPPGFDEAFAIPINLNSPTMDTMPDGEGLTTKYYRIILGNGATPGSYRVTILGDLNTDFQIYMYEADGYESFSGVIQGPDGYQITAININGLYYITVEMLGNPGSYTIEIATFAPIGSSFITPIPMGLNEELYQEMPGNGTDNSFYYAISLSQTMYEFTIGMSYIGDDVFGYIYDSNFALIGSTNTTSKYSENDLRIHVNSGTHYIKINSSTTWTIFFLNINEIPFGSSPDNPHVIQNNQFEGDFAGAPLSQWLSFNLGPPPNTNQLNLQSHPNETRGVNRTLAANFDCDGGNGLDVNIFDTHLNLLDEVSAGQCPFSMEFTTGFDEILIEVTPVFSEELPTYSVEMDCDTCTEDVPYGGPAPELGTFVWSYESENFFPYTKSECPNKHEIRVTISWSNMPLSFVNIFIDGNIDGDTPARVHSWNTEIQGTGSDTTVYSFGAKIIANFGSIISVYLNNADQGSEEDIWRPVCVEELVTIVTNGTTIYTIKEGKKTGPNDLYFVVLMFTTFVSIIKIKKKFVK